MNRTTIIVVTFNSADVIGRCLQSIVAAGESANTIVVDNASADATCAIVKRFPSVTLRSLDSNAGFGAANNRALAEVPSEFAFVLNPDAVVQVATVQELVAAAHRNERAAALGPLTLNDDGSVQVSFGRDLSLVNEWRQRKLVRGVKGREPNAMNQTRSLVSEERIVDWVSGAAMFLRVEPARSVGFFDERYFLYEEDADLCLRLRKAGHSVVFTPRAAVTHSLGTSMAKASARARDEYEKSHLLYYATHRSALELFLLRAWLWTRRARLSSVDAR